MIDDIIKDAEQRMEDVSGPANEDILDVLRMVISGPNCRCDLLHGNPPCVQL